MKSPYQPSVFPFDASLTIYTFTDEHSKVPLAFMFAVRDDFPANRPPVLDYIPDKTFKVGRIWEEFLTAEDPDNDLLKYSSDSKIFSVREDGWIEAKMLLPGTYSITFAVEDSRGGKDVQEATINVIE